MKDREEKRNFKNLCNSQVPDVHREKSERWNGMEVGWNGNGI
jgi:hypothetical protein